MTETSQTAGTPGLTRGQRLFMTVASAVWALVGIGLFVLAALADDDTVISWTESLNPGGWMAWVLPTGLFFWTIAGILIVFTYLALRYPETPKRGIFGFETTRGDRLFISLLAAGYINLAWLGLTEFSQWIALGISLAVAAVIFRLA